MNFRLSVILLLTAAVICGGRRHGGRRNRHHDNDDEVGNHDNQLDVGSYGNQFDVNRDGCAFGYEYSVSKGCVDVNECMEFPCKEGQTCKNLMGKYECLCPRGHKLNDTSDCVDINECDLGYCGKHTCVNNEGSYSCICPPGSKQIGRYCRDINECVHHPCKDQEYCINTRGSYRCECKMGYVRGGNDTCVDIDECANGEMCTAYGEHCVNTMGGYECQCNHGYEHDVSGRYCVDMDECKSNTSCGDNAECINTKGSFYCRCHRGFVKNDDGECTDVTDCSHGEGQKCQWKCKDVPGSFECLCPSGYDRSDFACIDINECDLDQQRHQVDGQLGETNSTGICPQNSTCVNTRGGHECIETGECPSSIFYQHVTRTDEFSKRQVTTNACRRRCKQFRGSEQGKYRECKNHPMSIQSHFIDVTSKLPHPRKLFRIKMKPRRRRQFYEFALTEGDSQLFGLKQVNGRSPVAYLYMRGELVGPATHVIKVDMTTYDVTRKKRDSRMVTVTVFVSQYEF